MSKTIKVLMWCAVLAMAFGAMSAFAGPEDAAPDGKAVLKNVDETVQAAMLVVQTGIMLVGIVLLGVGLHTAYRVNKENGQGQARLPTAFAGIVVGGAMIYFTLITGTVGKTVFGDNATRPGRIEIQQ